MPEEVPVGDGPPVEEGMGGGCWGTAASGDAGRRCGGATHMYVHHTNTIDTSYLRTRRLRGPGGASPGARAEETSSLRSRRVAGVFWLFSSFTTRMASIHFDLRAGGCGGIGGGRAYRYAHTGCVGHEDEDAWAGTSLIIPTATPPPPPPSPMMGAPLGLELGLDDVALGEDGGAHGRLAPRDGEPRRRRSPRRVDPAGRQGTGGGAMTVSGGHGIFSGGLTIFPPDIATARKCSMRRLAPRPEPEDSKGRPAALGA